MMETIRTWLIDRGLEGTPLTLSTLAAALLGIALLAFVANFVAKKIILRILSTVAGKTSTDWDDVLLEKRVLTRLSHIAPAIVIWYLLPIAVEGFPELVSLARSLAELYMLGVGLAVGFAFLNAVEAIYSSYEISQRVTITGYIQIGKLVVALAVGVIALSVVLDKSPWVFLSGLGAATAVLLLIFKDAILGFVAGIQIAANDMVRPGDWIEMPKYGADGDVIEMNLTTVKVRNWDKTVTTVPTYSLISDSFKNWRGMSESGGRRIKRSIYIDMNSIRFCTPEMLERFGKMRRLAEYVAKKREEIEAFNAEHDADGGSPADGRRMTNVGTFRAYLSAYLKEHPKIHRDMTFLVRHLQPTERGLPIEIYVFSNDQAWAGYESIQADIFDHVLAVLPEFDLRVFQLPSGHDLSGLRTA